MEIRASTQTSTREASVQQAREEKKQQEAWTVNDFHSIQSIGSGKFGKVFRAIEKRANVPVALKVVFKHMLEKFDFFSQMKRELEI